MAKPDHEKEQRLQNYEDARSDLLNQGFIESRCTLTILKANVMAVFSTAPIIIVCLLLYILRWDGISTENYMRDLFVFTVLLFISIPIHEAIHGLTWSLFCQHKWKSIHLGVMWRMLTPYCHCKEPLRFSAYILGSLAPLLMLGVGVFLLSFSVGNTVLLALSLANIASGGGDLTICLMLLRHRKATYILDHPTDLGCAIFMR